MFQKKEKHHLHTSPPSVPRAPIDQRDQRIGIVILVTVMVRPMQCTNRTSLPMQV